MPVTLPSKISQEDGLQDCQGLPVTTRVKAAIVAMDQFINESLYRGREAETAVREVVVRDPDWGYAHACAAAYYLSQESDSAHRQALVYDQQANRHRKAANSREKLYIAAISAWCKGAIEPTLNHFAVLTRKYPQDQLAQHQQQYLLTYIGERWGLM